MKKTLLFLIFIFISIFSYSQVDSTTVADTNTYRIIKTDGGELIGKILKQDSRELLVLTTDKRQIIIPQYVIKEIILVKSTDFSDKGDFIGEDKFATRYFLTTNGLPIKKGENYVQWNIFGPDFQFAVSDNLGMGIMTSWLGVPIIGTIKYSFELGNKTQFAIGGLVGTGSWAAISVGGAIPYATFSYGDRSKNVAVSAGYGGFWAEGDFGGRAITSIAGMIKVGRKFSLVFDSFYVLPGKTTYSTVTHDTYNPSTGSYEQVTNTYEETKSGMAVFIPGVRWHQGEGKAFQFGFTGIFADGDFLPIPIPMVQWYRSL